MISFVSTTVLNSLLMIRVFNFYKSPWSTDFVRGGFISENFSFPTSAEHLSKQLMASSYKLKSNTICLYRTTVYFHTNTRFAKHHLNKPKTVFCSQWIFSRFLKTKQGILGCYPLFPLSYVLSRTIICIPVYQRENPLSEINTAWYHCNKCLKRFCVFFLHKDHKMNA